MATREIATIKQPYKTNDGTTLYLGTVTLVDVDSNGKYIPNSARTNLRLYDTTFSLLGTDYKTVATRSAGQPWTLTKDASGKIIAGADLQKTLATATSSLNSNLNNNISRSLGAPLAGVPSGSVNTNTPTDVSNATGISPNQENQPTQTPTTPPGNPPPTTPNPSPPSTPSSTLTSVPVPETPPPTGDFSSDATGGVLRYPLNRSPQDDLDHLKITTFRYTAGGLPTGNENSFNVPTASSKIKTAVGPTVVLPMQPGIQDSNSVSWGDDRLNPIQGAFAGVAAQAIENLGMMDPGQAAATVFSGTRNIIQNLSANDKLGGYITAYFAGEAVGANVIGRTTGAVINNNLELLFNGPTLRTFNYNYTFTPRDDRESKAIRDIILHFKRHMAIKRETSKLFLVTPDVFQLQYVFKGGGEHPFLNKIKLCALTNMNVDYTPDGSYATYGDGSMTSYKVTLQFSELDPIYRDDQESATGMGY